MKDFHLSLPEPVFERLQAEAQRSRIPETTLALQAIERSLEPRLLTRVQFLFHLNRVELAGLFAVPERTIEHWERQGVPSVHQAKLATVVAIGELLERKLLAGALPGVARTPAVACDGRSMLGVIAANEQDTLLARVRASFDWAATA